MRFSALASIAAATAFAVIALPAAASSAPMLSGSALYWAIAATVFFATSEIIALLPIKANSWVQLLLSLGEKLFAKKPQ